MAEGAPAADQTGAQTGRGPRGGQVGVSLSARGSPGNHQPSQHEKMKHLNLSLRLLALSLGLLFGLAGGFQSAAVSSAAEEIKILRYRPVPMRDGVKLYADVYLPRAEGRYPTLVVRTPYGVQRDGVPETMIDRKSTR